MRRLFCVLVTASLVPLACDREQGRREAGADTAVAVDSVLSSKDALTRFRADLPAVTQLEGGAASRDELVRIFVRAIEKNDTATVRRLHVTRAEYAYLYFPSSVYMNEPYRQPPSIAWFLNTQNSEKGISRVTRRLAGHDLQSHGYTCTTEAREGENRFARACMLVYFDQQDGKQVTRRLFGTILERGGQHKFLSYANDF